MANSFSRVGVFFTRVERERPSILPSWGVRGMLFRAGSTLILLMSLSGEGELRTPHGRGVLAGGAGDEDLVGGNGQEYCGSIVAKLSERIKEKLSKCK